MEEANSDMLLVMTCFGPCKLPCKSTKRAELSQTITRWLCVCVGKAVGIHLLVFVMLVVYKACVKSS